MEALQLNEFPIAANVDDEMIKRLATVDRSMAVDLVVRKYRDRLFNHAVYVLKDYQEAFDVTQEVFIKAMRERRFFDEDFKMKAWMFRVTSNLCFNMVRDRRRRGAILETFPQPRATEADQIDRVFAEERQDTILEAMARLTANHREILALRYEEEFTTAEIADILAIPEGTVKSRLYHARRRLREIMQGDLS